MKRLMEKSIETRPFFVPMHQQPVLREMGLFKCERYRIAEILSEKGINLPSSSSLSVKDIEFVCENILSLQK